jgi:hypothetical protein
MKRLRDKLTYSNVMVTVLAVVVLGGGTAYAATQMLPKNSVGPKQLKKGAVTPSKLSTAAKSALLGKRGPSGAIGPQGPAGSQGPIGPQGQFVDVVPSGKTLVGTYAQRDHATLAGQDYIAAISFGFRFSTAPTPHFVALGTTPPVQCPGNGLNPQAAPGNLCIYETSMVNRSAPLIFDVNFDPNSSSTFGASVLTESLAAGTIGTSGSWAATAP